MGTDKKVFFNIIHGYFQFKDTTTEKGVYFYSYGKVVKVTYFENSTRIFKYKVERVKDMRNYLLGIDKSTEILEYDLNSVPEELKMSLKC